MMTCKVVISGPGQTFDAEYYLILKALQDFGFEVIQKNDFPISHEDQMQDHLRRISENLKEKSRKVSLVAVHQPWGG